MQTISVKQKIRQQVLALKKEGKSIGFVPTMGALHAGHISLVERAVAENDVCVVSVFVNPTQFNNARDLEKYPRNLSRDADMLQKAGCAYLFAPSETEMYPEKDTRDFDFGHLETVMEGKHRPGHFRGVAQIVSKLFEAIPANRAYFGQKDFQQLAVVRELVRQLSLNISIVGCPIVREPHGLAMSSRNELLSPQQRKDAGILYQTLQYVKKQAGKQSLEDLCQWAVQNINNKLTTEYLEIVDTKTLKTATNWQTPNGLTACVAAYAGEVRLIDNVQLVP